MAQPNEDLVSFINGKNWHTTQSAYMLTHMANI